jgi:hypothetical protein
MAMLDSRVAALGSELDRNMFAVRTDVNIALKALVRKLRNNERRLDSYLAESSDWRAQMRELLTHAVARKAPAEEHAYAVMRRALAASRTQAALLQQPVVQAILYAFRPPSAHAGATTASGAAAAHANPAMPVESRAALSMLVEEVVRDLRMDAERSERGAKARRLSAAEDGESESEEDGGGSARKRLEGELCEAPLHPLQADITRAQYKEAHSERAYRVDLLRKVVIAGWMVILVLDCVGCGIWGRIEQASF